MAKDKMWVCECGRSEPVQKGEAAHETVMASFRCKPCPTCRRVMMQRKDAEPPSARR